MKYGVWIIVLIFGACVGCNNGSGDRTVPDLRLTLEGDALVLNDEWVEWLWSLRDDTLPDRYAAPLAQLYKAMATRLDSNEFAINDFIDADYSGQAYALSYLENLDSDPQKEYVFITGGLSEKSLMFVLDAEEHHFRMVHYVAEDSYDQYSEVKFLNAGVFYAFEVIAEQGGSTDFGGRWHHLYRMTGDGVHEVLRLREGIDVGGTLKVRTSVELRFRDSSDTGNALVADYTAQYWLCNVYDAGFVAPADKQSWEQYGPGTCDPCEGITLLNNRYSMLFVWSADSLYYTPVYSGYGVTPAQHNILQNINSTERYAHDFFRHFHKDIKDYALRTSLTIDWLEQRFLE